MKILTDAEKEDLRHAVLDVLSTRAPAALPLAGIRRRMVNEVDFDFTEADVAAVLFFLADKNLVKAETDPLGSSKWWRITADGQLAVERGGQN